MSTSRENKQLQLANDFVQQTDHNIFLTGKAGTGKTTFLHNLRKNTAKRVIVTAPTGVAAINAGGVTLHSFFQLPFGPYVPGSEAFEKNRQKQFRFNKKKKQIIQSLDLLVIDEISMVRADVLDAVDATLRRQRRNELPFGGIQLLMIGDLHQLSPVAKRDEWQLLQDYYDSVYFFSSMALAKTEFLTIELNHIYRQSDPKFVELLNKVRDNALDDNGSTLLNSRYQPNFNPQEHEGYITLTTHNQYADSLNEIKLNSLNSKQHSYQAEITGDFPEKIYPAPGTLYLKKGAQVMFVKNDSDPEKRYYNGKIGTVSSITPKSIKVLCPGDNNREIAVEPEEWQNIQYKLNEESKEIEEKIVGEFEQYPLKLAWAITIHKSQGLTFERAVIDAQDAFAHGQVYVALSRCKTLEGMVLSSKLSSSEIKTDRQVLSFDNQANQNQPTKERLEKARIQYQQQLLLQCFNLDRLQQQLNFFIQLVQGNARTVQLTGINDFDLISKTAAEIFKVAKSFQGQLQTIFQEQNLPESDPKILERISKASTWFQDKLSKTFKDFGNNIQINSNNKQLTKKLERTLDNLRQEITIKYAGISCCAPGFKPSSYLRAISRVKVDSESGKKTKSN